MQWRSFSCVSGGAVAQLWIAFSVSCDDSSCDAVVVTHPHLPLARGGGCWGSGIFFVLL